MWKRIATVLAIFIAGFLLFALSLPLIVPTAQDAKVSSIICKHFKTAAESIVTNKQISIIGSTRRGKTDLLVGGNLSDSEKKALQELADKIGQTNGNRQVMVFFK